MGKSDAWMPLYVSDFYEGTAHLSTESTGAYALVMLCMWTRDAMLPDDDTVLARVARLTPDRWAQVRLELEPLFEIKNGHWVQLRLKREKELAIERHTKRSEAAAKRWCKADAKHDAMHDPLHVQPQPQPQPQVPEGTHPPLGAGPSLGDCIAAGNMRGLTEEDASLFWHHYESVGWVTAAGIPIRNWQSKLMVWKTSNQARKHEADAKAKAGGSGGDFWKDMKLYEHTEKAITTMRQNMGQDPFGQPIVSDANRERWQHLLQQRRELKARLGL